jgi:cysteinyl-tRNA synthetase
VVFDVVRRYLTATGLHVTLVRNITDIDDKIIDKSRRRGLDLGLLSDYYTYRYQGAMARLNVLPADAEPRASEYIPQIIAFITELMRRGHAYQAGAGVYFAVDSITHYGRLSGRRQDRTFGAFGNNGDVYGKRNPADFALWKAARSQAFAWPSPWGMGRPGWHIECSAMSTGLLGEVFDIHGGGADLIFPHHENEIAQAVGRYGTVPATVWMHHGMVTAGGCKISKSDGGYIKLHDLSERYPVDVIRLFLLSKRYRHPLDFSKGAMDRITRNLARLHQFLTRFQKRISMVPQTDTRPGSKTWDRFCEAMDDDFNLPMALAAVFEGIRRVNREMRHVAHRPIAQMSPELNGEIRDILRLCRDVLGLRMVHGKGRAHHCGQACMRSRAAVGHDDSPGASPWAGGYLMKPHNENLL